MTGDEQAAFDRLAAFRDRYTDEHAVINATSGLTVGDLDTLLLRLHRLKDVTMIPEVDASGMLEYLATHGLEPKQL